MRYLAFVTLLALSVTNTALARPISYPEGWTVMQMNNWERSHIHGHYSPNIKNSIGVVLSNDNRSDRYDANLQWNHLIGRRNTKHSQANLYLKTQAGLAFEGDKKEPHASIGVAGDWETRRYFVSYEMMGTHTNRLDERSFHQNARIGIAPYLADYGSIHSWIMLQVEHHPEEIAPDDQVIFTPIIRVFKGDYLSEFGVNTNGDAMFNWIVRF